MSQNAVFFFFFFTTNTTTRSYTTYTDDKKVRDTPTRSPIAITLRSVKIHGLSLTRKKKNNRNAKGNTNTAQKRGRDEGCDEQSTKTHGFTMYVYAYAHA